MGASGAGTSPTTYPGRVLSPLEKLERAYQDTLDASGADFFRRLREYAALLTKRGPIKRAVNRLRRKVMAADKTFVKEDWQPGYNAGANPIAVRLTEADLVKPAVRDLLGASFEALNIGARPWSESAPNRGTPSDEPEPVTG